MTLVCPHCVKAIDYSGEQPRFCGFCGESLSSTPAATTAAYEAVDAAHAETLPPHKAAPANALPAAPERVGGYRLLRTLGSGGMGTVYEAEDANLGRRVALKLISPQFAQSRDTIERFRQEGRLASAIAHPRCVFVVAADEDAGRPYIVMELMPGSTLDDLVRRDGPLPPEQAVLRILDVIEGLQEAHRLGVIHRDVKPNNCFVDADGRVKIGDFGLSKSLVSDHQLTKTGSFLGTPLYSSPEQIRGEQVDEQTDVYSVAATLYFLLTGKAPFQSGDAMASLARIAADDAPSMRTVRPDIPAGLDGIVLRGLERDRRRRWQNLDDFAEALRNFLPRQLSMGGLGIRLAAFFLDSLIGALVVLPIGFLLISTMVKDQFGDVYAQVELHLPRLVLGLTFWTLYFGIPESFWGWSSGKLLLGLRVRQIASGDPPGLVRALSRALTVNALNELYSTLVILALAFTATPGMSWHELFDRDPLVWALATAMGPGQLLMAAMLICWPMRKENGYRGVHDFLFGTMVVAAPGRRRQAAFPGIDLCERVRRDPAAAFPKQLGPFVVEGMLHESGQERWLLAREPTLNRSVWLWMRPATEQPLPPVRRELGRITRPRWLAAGELDDWRWDALLATPGVPLSELPERGKRYSWADVRPVIEQLTDELITATDEGTVPAQPDLKHVLLQQTGRVVLLDTPVLNRSGGEGGRSESAASAPHFMPTLEGAEKHGLGLLRDVSNVLLEGRVQHEAGARAPVPGHARAMLDRLTGVSSPYRALREFELELVATRGLPTEVTRARRAAHLALLSAFMISPLFMMIFGAFLASTVPMMELVVETERRVDTPKRFRHVLPADVATMANPDPWVRLHGAMQFERDSWLERALEARVVRDRRLHEVAAHVNQPALAFATFIIDTNRRQPGIARALRPWSDDYRSEAEAMAFFMVASDPADEGLWLFVAWVLAWPIVWIIWAFLFRGGLTFRATGLMLVRRDGRRAARWQCAWRAVLTWSPVVGLFILSFILSWQFWAGTDVRLMDRSDLSGPNYALAYLSTACFLLGLALPVVYVLLPLWRPTRSWHDRLAGTYLVPK